MPLAPAPSSQPQLQGFSHNLMHLLCFAAYNCAYPYMAHLYLTRSEWQVLG